MDELSRLCFISRAIHVAAELAIADHLGEGITEIAELSERTDTHTQSLERLMKFLASYGIFREVKSGGFAETELSEVLRTDHPNSIRPTMRQFRDEWWSAVGQLEYSIKTGKPAFDNIFGMPVFEYRKDNPDLQKRFDEGMARISKVDDTAIAAAYDFTRFRRIVDVGGGRAPQRRAGDHVRALRHSHRGAIVRRIRAICAIGGPLSGQKAAGPRGSARSRSGVRGDPAA